MKKKFLAVLVCLLLLGSMLVVPTMAKYKQDVTMTGIDLTIDGTNVPKSLAVTTPPENTSYFIGNDFDPTGMKLTVTYTDGTTKEVEPSDCVITNGDDLAEGQISIMIQYTENATTVATTQAIIMKYRLSYELGGGSVETANPEYYTAQDDDFTLNKPTMEGYRFAGWTGSNGTTPQETVTILKGATGDKAYVANWEEDEAVIPVVQAIYSADDTSLTFVVDRLYSVGDSFVDGDGITKSVTAVYTGFDSEEYSSESNVPWNGYAPSITQVEVRDEIKPSSTAYWFYDFQYCEVFDLEKLNTSSVVNMEYMFYKAGYRVTAWNVKGLSTWDVSSVKDMNDMFVYAGYNVTTWDIGDLSAWDVSGVMDMNAMFNNAGYKATTWNVGDLSAWDVSGVTNMMYMFAYAGRSATTWDIGDLSAWDVASVTNMMNMFGNAGYNATTWNIGDISAWDVSGVTDMYRMFNYAGYKATTWDIGDLSAWDVSSVTDMYEMFNYAGRTATTWNIGDLSAWDVSSVTDMSSMFNYAGRYATTWNIGDLSAWDVSSVTDMSYMFDWAGGSATTWNIGDLSAWDVSAVTDMEYMFAYAGYKATKLDIGDLSAWDVSGVTGMEKMFAYAGHDAITWNIGDLSAWDVSGVTNMYSMFNCAGYNANYSLNLSSWDVSNVTRHTDFDTGVEDKIISPWDVTSLSLAPAFTLPEGIITGSTMVICSMPDTAILTEDACDNAPADSTLYGWLVDSGMAQAIVLPDELEVVLASVYEQEPNWEMVLTPLYIEDENDNGSEFITGCVYELNGMPDLNVIMADAESAAPDSSVFYGWQAVSDNTDALITAADIENYLLSFFEEYPESPITITAVYTVNKSVETVENKLEYTCGNVQNVVERTDIAELISLAETEAEEGHSLYGFEVVYGGQTQQVAKDDLATVLTKLFETDPEWQVAVTPLYQPLEDADGSEAEQAEETALESVDPDAYEITDIVTSTEEGESISAEESFSVTETAVEDLDEVEEGETAVSEEAADDFEQAILLEEAEVPSVNEMPEEEEKVPENSEVADSSVLVDTATDAILSEQLEVVAISVPDEVIFEEGATEELEEAE